MNELKFETSIRAPIGQVFSLLSELRDYGFWLPRSSAFHGTTEISPGPIAVGTTYIEKSPSGTRVGRVVAFERPHRIDFEQPMTMRPEFLGSIGIKLHHDLSTTLGVTRVRRSLELSPSGPVTWFMPFVRRAFEAENDRMLAALKQAAEALEAAGKRP